jgi:hypothetical protein
MNLKQMIHTALDLDMQSEVCVVNINDPRTEEVLVETNNAHPVVQIDQDEDGHTFIYFAGPVPGTEDPEIDG